MKTSVEPLEGNKVKVSVEVDEAEFDKALDAAFRRIAREVRIPGFRPGKAPRALLQARIGADVARDEALRDSLPEYYEQALREHELDAIAPPDIDITGGKETGPLVFDAVVELRPQVQVPGYDQLEVTVPSPEPTDEEVTRQVDRLRDQFGELRPVSRPARDGDHLSIDLHGYRHDEAIEGLSADDFLYELGSGSVLPELDTELQGAKTGDILKFNAELRASQRGEAERSARPGVTVPEQDEVTLQVLVKEVREKILPDVTDEWASEASEFETVDELRTSITERMAAVKRVQAALSLREAVVDAVADLVTDEVPEPLVGAEMERRVHDLSHRLEAQGADLAAYLEATGTSQDDFLAGLRDAATKSVKADLAMRAVAEAEGLEVSEEDLEGEIAQLAERLETKASDLRKRVEQAGQLPTVRSDIRKAHALRWLLDHVEIVDEQGHAIDRSELLAPTTDDTPGAGDDKENPV
jgi:trigger factor